MKYDYEILVGSPIDPAAGRAGGVQWHSPKSRKTTLNVEEFLDPLGQGGFDLVHVVQLRNPGEVMFVLKRTMPE